MVNKSQDNNLQQLLELIWQCHNLGELKSLYFELGIDREVVPEGSNKRDFAEYLILYMARRNKQKVLINTLKKRCPHLPWPDFYKVHFEESQLKHMKNVNHVEQYVENQQINITYNQSTQQKKSNQKRKKSPRISNAQKSANIEIELYERVFIHTKLLIQGLLIMLLILLVYQLIMFASNRQQWLNNLTETLGLILLGDNTFSSNYFLVY